jgi:hypothetical protein
MPVSHLAYYPTCWIVNNINNGDDDNEYDESDTSDGDGDSDCGDDSVFDVFDFSANNLFSKKENCGRLQWATPEAITDGVFE